MPYSSNNNKQGFTVIELVVSVAIGSVLLGIAVSMFNVQRKAFSLQDQETEMRQNMRAAMDYMSREIRMAGYGTTTLNVITPVPPPGSTTSIIIFSADIDDDGTVDQISYNHDSTDLQIERNSQPIAENIETLEFSEFGTNTVTGATNNVTIAITARTVKSDPTYIGDGYRRGTLTSTIDIRNR